MARGTRPIKSLKPKEERAVNHLCQIKFHQSIRLPADPERGRPEPGFLTYSDVDYREQKDSNGGPTVLFFGGMYGGRWLAAGLLDALARKHRVRVIIPDKFGLGGSSNVPLEWRVVSFTNAIPTLLDHLRIKHVAFISHSAGTIYQFNALIKLRDRLHPRSPYACFLAPWVHQSHSGSLGALSIVPDYVLGRANSIIKFLNTNVTQTLAWSAALVPSSSLPKETDIKNVASEAESENELQRSESIMTTADDSNVADYNHDDAGYSSDRNPGNTYSRTLTRYLFAENTCGGAYDGMLCLKRGENPSWGLMDDYDDAMDKIIMNEKLRLMKQDRARAKEAGAKEHDNKMLIEIFFPETDVFCGIKGMKWMDNLLKSKEESSGCFNYRSSFIDEADHDGILSADFMVGDKIFTNIRKFWGV